jgi:hypothetical protein
MSEKTPILERARIRFQPLIAQRMSESAAVRKPKELLAVCLKCIVPLGAK